MKIRPRPELTIKICGMRAFVIQARIPSGQGGSREAYKNAGIVDPLTELDFVELHDAYTSSEIQTYEDMGLCRYGEGGTFAVSGKAFMSGVEYDLDLPVEPICPVNPSGGLISRGHPIGASGLAQIYELVTQLRGEAGERQVKSHRIAMTENGGGTVGAGEAAMTIHILEKS